MPQKCFLASGFTFLVVFEKPKKEGRVIWSLSLTLVHDCGNSWIELYERRMKKTYENATYQRRGTYSEERKAG